jgi:hypothetical protein
MKNRALVFCAGLIVGCQQDQQPAQQPAPAPTAVAPAPTTPKATSKLYFEMTKDGRTYVFGHLATMQKVNAGEKVDSLVVKEGFGPAGETVVFESDGSGLEKRLTEDYQKQHPKK